MSTNLYIKGLTAEEIKNTMNMSTAEYTAYVNGRVNMTDVIAEDLGSKVNLYHLPY